MGYYVNHREMDKEAWLQLYGKYQDSTPQSYRNGNDIAVCLIDNGWMSAAGIAYSTDEFEAFKYPDGRQKFWYMVPLGKLEEVAPGITKVVYSCK